MKIETCIRYLDFVSNECSRHLNDGSVTDDELIHLIIELQRFKETCMESDLAWEMKAKIAELKLNYTIKGVERNTWYLIAAFATVGSWAMFIHMRQQSKRKRTLNELKFDTARLASSIRIKLSSGM